MGASPDRRTSGYCSTYHFASNNPEREMSSHSPFSRQRDAKPRPRSKSAMCLSALYAWVSAAMRRNDTDAARRVEYASNLIDDILDGDFQSFAGAKTHRL